jgi:hypothetical protein
LQLRTNAHRMKNNYFYFHSCNVKIISFHSFLLAQCVCLEAVQILGRICNDVCRGTDACKISMHLFREVTTGSTHMENLNVHSIRICYLLKRLFQRFRSSRKWRYLAGLLVPDVSKEPFAFVYKD